MDVPDQEEGERIHPFSTFLFCSSPHLCEDGSSLFSLLTQVLTSSINTVRDTLRNNVLPAIWASFGPAKVTHKINHHTIQNHQPHEHQEQIIYTQGNQLSMRATHKIIQMLELADAGFCNRYSNSAEECKGKYAQSTEKQEGSEVKGNYKERRKDFKELSQVLRGLQIPNLQSKQANSLGIQGRAHYGLEPEIFRLETQAGFLCCSLVAEFFPAQKTLVFALKF